MDSVEVVGGVSRRDVRSRPIAGACRSGPSGGSLIVRCGGGAGRSVEDHQRPDHGGVHHAHTHRHRVHHPRRRRRLARRRRGIRTPAGRSRRSSSTRRPTRSRAASRPRPARCCIGRVSYDEFAPVWPTMDEFAEYNAMPKYVVSTTLTRPRVEQHHRAALARRGRGAQGGRGRHDPACTAVPRSRRASPRPAWSTGTTCWSSRCCSASGKRLFSDGDRTRLQLVEHEAYSNGVAEGGLRRRALTLTRRSKSAPGDTDRGRSSDGASTTGGPHAARRRHQYRGSDDHDGAAPRRAWTDDDAEPALEVRQAQRTRC